MKKIKKSLVALVCLVASFSVSSVYGEELSAKVYWRELKNTFSYMKEGSLQQFTEKNNLYIAAAATPILWYSFKEDKRLSNHAMNKKISKFSQVVSDLSPVLSFPFLHAGFLTYGLKYDSSREVEFAKETMATMYIVLLESAALSVIDIHERPRQETLSKWETQFRGSSSFPSGHVIPFAALTMKTYQFYGPTAAVIPFGLYVATSIQRVRDGKHYVSDVVGSFFLTMFAAEGVRKASGYEYNHPLYKALFERNLNISYLYYKGSIGPKITFDW